MAEDLDDFVRCLTWTEPELSCPLAWKRDYLALLRQKAAPLLAADSEIAGAVRRLSPEQAQRALLSPHVIWALIERPDPENAARRLADEVAAIAADRPSSQTMDVADGIWIDYEPSFFMPGALLEGLGATPKKLRGAQKRSIAAGLSALRLDAPTAFDFVRALTTRIAIRSRLDRPDWHLFGSLVEYPGVTLLVNPWGAGLDLAGVVECLVHENIHHCISLYKRLKHDVTEGLPPALTHRSPWTGNELSCHNFVEACFVLWGLYNLWSSWPRDSAIAAPCIDRFRGRAGKGFADRPGHSLVRAVGAERLPGNTVAALLQIDDAALQARSASA
jgi:hypothetical protein